MLWRSLDDRESPKVKGIDLHVRGPAKDVAIGHSVSEVMAGGCRRGAFRCCD